MFRSRTFLTRSFRPWHFWCRTFRPCYFGPGRSILDILDLDVLPPWDFGPGHFAPGHFGPGCFAPRTFRHGSFWTWTFRFRTFWTSTFRPLTFWTRAFRPLIIVFYTKYMFQLKVLLGEFRSNFSWRYFTIHVTLLCYVRDYATLYSYWLLLRWTWIVIEQ